MKATQQELKIAGLIEPAITDLGYDLLQVRLIGSQKLQTLQIMAEHPETGTLDLNACTAISRSVSALLDVEDPITSAYQLEVSSPGIDRPLLRSKDFEKHVGYEVTVETDVPNEDGQKRFRGKMTGFSDDVITLVTDEGEIKISLADVIKAKLVLTDELVKAALKKNK